MTGKICKHTKTIPAGWYPNPHYSVQDAVHLGDEYMEEAYFWEDEWEQPTTVDVDIHHFKCTQCGKIIPYCGGKIE